MSDALQIGGHSLVLCVRSEFLTLKKAIIRYEHNVREVKHASKIGYLRGNSRNNRYTVLSEYNDNGNMREMPNSDREFSDRKYIKALLKKYHEKMKSDYEAQTKIYKNGKVVKNRWRENMVGFSEIVISFGTDRNKESKEGLNKTEVNFINAQVSLDRVRRFANDYCAKYGVKCLLIAEHNDEKTKHYQLIFTNYQFENHKNLRFNGKGETLKFGRSMQEMGGAAFKGIALRGELGSKMRHINIKQMHKTEKEYSNEQKFKNKIRQSIVDEARKYIKKYCLLARNHSLHQYTEIVNKTVSYIELNYTDELSLSSLAGHFHVSKNYLSAVFKKQIGKTVTEYIHDVRLDKAIFFLNTTKSLKIIPKTIAGNVIRKFSKTTSFIARVSGS